MAWFDKLSRGLSNTRNSFTESMNVLFRRGPKLDENFYDDLEETLILGDMGFQAAEDIVASVRDTARRKALPDAQAVMDLLEDSIAQQFKQAERDPFTDLPSLVLFVGINGAGKTTTVGKLAKIAKDRGDAVLIGSADTFRAAAIEQLDIWGERAGVEIVKRERGADPASVCYDVIQRGEETGAQLILIDTSGRLHTSKDLMRELQKVVNVTRKRSGIPVSVVLVMDATTGQNGLQQAREFNKSLDLDGVIITKLDGTAKGGIAVAVSRELELPIYRIGVGESIDDLQAFDAHEFARALITG
ncbi:MAG: signal recognition particle-docking protein FtsY [Coriobacteriales bacterium]|nr:signal recognition particle-docking protein FtsY [Coriobacteriales bacterium]